MRFELCGVEALTIEVSGTIAASDARALAGAARLDPEAAADGRAVVGLLLFTMRGLKLAGAPGPRFDYREALWRLGVVRDGRPSWLAIRCDIDDALVRRTGAMLIRYPVREATLAMADGEAWSARVETGARSFAVAARPGEETAPAEPPRPAFVLSGGRLYRVPWDEEAAPFRRHAAISARGDLDVATFGAAVRWDATGLVHRGRVHRCGLAARCPPQ